MRESPNFNGVSCLVTGGAGFIGSHVAQRLVQAGARVRILDDLSSGREENLAAIRRDVEFTHGDIRDGEKLAKLLPGVEVVFHLAAIPSVIFSIEHPAESLSVNFHGTAQLAQAACRAGVRRLIFSSSCAIYGLHAAGALTEDRLPEPASPYATAKLACEHLLRNFHELYGLETVCLRYFNVFGPRQDPASPYGAVIPKFIHALLSGEPPVIYGDGRQTRDFIPVDQVAWTNLQATAAPAGTVVNVGRGRSMDLWELLDHLREASGLQIGPRLAPARTGEVRDSLADTQHYREIFGEYPGPGVVDALALTVAWYRENLSRLH